jgi:hydrogenase expression/formation protein HypC
MCWGVPGVLIDMEPEKGIARVDFGDGVPREVLIGITGERLERGSLVIVHAGVIISTIDEKGLVETYSLLSDLVRDAGEQEDEGMRSYYDYLLRLSRQLRGGDSS